MAYLEKRGKNSWRLVVNAGYDANGQAYQTYQNG
ncbi:hypothetical protein J2S00_002489 [Caldalkalibacillus uzonensis]|uniref:Uncharacterized protein n=1 Tax=Caldalkalibacillus uzonensis TaxID=353224 RepID=A0ABU0CTF0_9BACI|nr:hypothetical protein [Caldalkalibacillus uzonensis]